MSTGVDANIEASNVGLNWTLDAGGIMNNVIKGFEGFSIEFRSPLRKSFPDDPDDNCNVISPYCSCRKFKYDDFIRPADFLNVVSEGYSGILVGLKSIGWFFR